MTILGLHPIDAAVIVGCLAVFVMTGAIFGKKAKSESEYFVGGRRLGTIFQVVLWFGAATDPAVAPIVASEVYRYGASGVWIPMQALFNTPFLWFTSVWSRRHRQITGPDVLTERFNSRRLVALFALLAVLGSPLGLAMGNMVSYKVVSYSFPKMDSELASEERESVRLYAEYDALKVRERQQGLDQASQLRMSELDAMRERGEIRPFIPRFGQTGFLFVYVCAIIAVMAMGGLMAAAYADIFQAVLVITVTISMVVFGLLECGGFSGLHERLPRASFDLLSSSSGNRYSLFSVASFTVMGVLTIGNIVIGGCGSAKDERAARKGILIGAYSKRLILVAWMLTGLIAMALLPEMGHKDPEAIWSALSQRILPVGLYGLVIGAVLVGHIPAAGMGALGTAAVFLRNGYQVWCPGKTQAHYMLVARLAMAAILLLSIAVASLNIGVIDLFASLVGLGCFSGVAGLLMIAWRGLSSRAVGIGMVVWFAAFTVLPFAVQYSPASNLESLCRRSDLTLCAQRDVPAEQSNSRSSTPIFFDRIINESNGAEPVCRGVGRFNVELYILNASGFDLNGKTAADLKGYGWLVSAVLPFVILIGLSLVLPDRRPRAAPGSVIRFPSPEEYAKAILNGNLALILPSGKDETAEQAAIRLDRFYAKQRTPIGRSQEEDERVLAESFRDPSKAERARIVRWGGIEINRLTCGDVVGFSLACLLVLVVLGVMLLVLSIGSW
ncbi:MAG: hypothetical protein L6R48_07350 [Planctomycetes bacterium]|nr:hypothetical protein [Planctomycetota bacterium]